MWHHVDVSNNVQIKLTGFFGCIAQATITSGRNIISSTWKVNSSYFIFLYIFQAELLENLLSEAEQVHIRRREASEMLQVCLVPVFNPDSGEKTIYLTAKLENSTRKFFILFIILGNYIVVDVYFYFCHFQPVKLNHKVIR